MTRQEKRVWVEELYLTHRTRIFRFCLVILKDTHLAEDALQTTFLKVQQSPTHPKPGRERSWLMSIARNAAYDILRSIQWEQPDEDALLHRTSEQTGWEYTDLLDGLSKLDREIVTLHVIGGLTHKEIAQLLRMSVHGEKKRYERALAALRRQLEGE